MKISKESKTKQVTYFEHCLRLTDDELKLVRVALGATDNQLAVEEGVSMEGFLALYDTVNDYCEGLE